MMDIIYVRSLAACFGLAITADTAGLVVSRAANVAITALVGSVGLKQVLSRCMV
jgi:hypothetical protein